MTTYNWGTPLGCLSHVDDQVRGCSKLYPRLLRVDASSVRSQVTGHRSQVTGHGSQVTGHERLESQLEADLEGGEGYLVGGEVFAEPVEVEAAVETDTVVDEAGCNTILQTLAT